MVANEWNPREVFEVLPDERARSILIATNNQKHSVKDLDRLLNASQSSIYRRVDVMVEFGLLEEQMKIDGEGHHYSVYEPNFEKIDIRLEDDRVIARVYADEESVCKWEFEKVV